MAKDEEEETPRKGIRTAAPRLSLTMSTSLHRKVRLVAAIHDMTEPEWCRIVIVTASKRLVEKRLPNLGK